MIGWSVHPIGECDDIDAKDKRLSGGEFRPVALVEIFPGSEKTNADELPEKVHGFQRRATLEPECHLFQDVPACRSDDVRNARGYQIDDGSLSVLSCPRSHILNTDAHFPAF